MKLPKFKYEGRRVLLHKVIKVKNVLAIAQQITTKTDLTSLEKLVFRKLSELIKS